MVENKIEVECLFCELGFKKIDEYAMHLGTTHKYDIAFALANLQFIMNRRIEKLDRAYHQDVKENDDDDYPSINGGRIGKARDELKDILVNLENVLQS